MILQRDKRLSANLRNIGCEPLSVMAACEIATDTTLDVDRATGLWKGLVYSGLASAIHGMNDTGSYRSLIQDCCRDLGRPDLIGDMVADVVGGVCSFYLWWHSSRWTHVLERRVLPDGTPHTVLLSEIFRPLYNSVPGLEKGVVVSHHLLWIGTRADWVHFTS